MAPVRLSSLFLLCILLGVALPHTEAAAPSYLTRSEAAMLLIRSAHLPLEATEHRGRYPDIIDGEWYAPYMLTAAHRGMLDPQPTTGLLRPHLSVSRADFLKMMTIAFDLPVDLPYSYSDVPRTAWYRRYAGVASLHGLFRDTLNPLLLRPDMRMTHAEAIEAVTQVLAHAPQLHPVQANKRERLLRSEIVAQETLTTAIPPPPLEPHTTLQQPSNAVTTPSMVKQALLRLLRQDSDRAEETKLSIIQRVNAERRAHGLPIVVYNAELTNAADRHAQDMSTRGYFSHFTPEGLSYVDRIRAMGYMDSPLSQCLCQPVFDLQEATVTPTSVLLKTDNLCDCSVRFGVGENIAQGQLTPAQVMQEWMASPAHRRNILEPSFQEIGIGIFGKVWVQNFGFTELEGRGEGN